MKLINRTLAGSLFAGLVVLGSAAHGAVLSFASNYNIYVLGNMTQWNVDSEGRVAVAGDASLTNYGVGSKFSSNPSSAGDMLVVGGNLSYNGGEVHYGNLVYGGTLSGNFGIPHGTTTHGSAMDFATANNYLTSASSYWGGMASNGATTNQWGGIQMVGTDPTLNIFTLSGAMLGSSWGVTIDAPAGSTVLVNVTGDSAAMQNMGLNFQDLNSDGTGTVVRNNVIYNFVDATSLTLNGVGVQGSILAPKATVNFNNGNIDGQLIAGTLIGTGEAHNYLFQGNLPAPLPIPEPSSALLVGLAGGMLAMRRKRSH
ncbi:choice-of-anchor A family protein [Luteolibacter luteus]|uniref:Choice-of-anchor A family protein n=1 Tax=Luteolibacter luteus TaxID=2728835 RepID=A0A858RRC7_9BACT|nr:choice-of-anchor A family protein [Luteolibacter luteus]QJE98690.1 choice-of-anchor A family protein [Luteolibacter luteus]